MRELNPLGGVYCNGIVAAGRQNGASNRMLPFHLF